ncbi:MAG: hypothetical protein SNH13_04540, partial [Rikenellaceae bacterium]
GGLLPHLFTLTCLRKHRRLFSVTLLHPHERQAINLRSTLRCSDFPLPSLKFVFKTPPSGSDRADLRDKGSNKK